MAAPPEQTLPADYYEDLRPQLRGGLIFFCVLATLPVLTRVALNVKIHRRLSWDDVWIIIATILMDAYVGVNLYGISIGLGLHASRVMMSDPRPPSVFITLWKTGVADTVLTQVCLFAVKISLLLLYKRLFWVARWFRIFWWCNVIYAICWVIPAFFTSLFECWPISYTWDRLYVFMHIPPPHPVHGVCISQYFATANASLNIISDVGIWALPMAAVLKLKMTRKRKTATCLLLSFGLVAVVCSIGKAVDVYRAISSYDVSWSNMSVTLWCVAEQSVAILCASIPVIVGAVRTLRQQHSQSSQASKKRNKTWSRIENSDNSSRGDARDIQYASASSGKDDSKVTTLTASVQDTTEDLEMQPRLGRREWA